MTQLITENAVCKTALATLGMLTTREGSPVADRLNILLNKSRPFYFQTSEKTAPGNHQYIYTRVVSKDQTYVWAQL